MMYLMIPCAIVLDLFNSIVINWKQEFIIEGVSRKGI